MIRQMGVRTDYASDRDRLVLRQRFRAGVWVVVAAIRLGALEKEWRGMRRMGEGLKRP